MQHAPCARLRLASSPLAHRFLSSTTKRCLIAYRTSAAAMFQQEAYSPPEWAASVPLKPPTRVHLAQLPTPVHRWQVPGLPQGAELWIKRDDLTGMQLSGNKVRKLEFILAEALARGHDSVITIGGIQSNHARATAVAARYLGLECHLLLRTSRVDVGKDPGLVGNLLVERLAGAHVHLCTKEEYGQYGQAELGKRLEQQLRAQGLNPYVVPVGGSSPLGVWGYLEATKEIAEQIKGQGFTDIAMACGSGGTTAGLALGAHLAGLGIRVRAYCVCDTPEYFYSDIQGLLDGMGATKEAVGLGAQDLVTIVQARGAGYAISKQEELEVCRDVALATGVVLDPVYTGKAVHGLLQEMRAEPAAWAGRKVLFLHTGGLLGLYEKTGEMQPLVESLGRSHRLRL